MLPHVVQKLLVRIGKKMEHRMGVNARRDPEACLVALLLQINEDITSVSAMLRLSVEQAYYGDAIIDARRRLRRRNTRLARAKRKNNANA